MGAIVQSDTTKASDLILDYIYICIEQLSVADPSLSGWIRSRGGSGQHVAGSRAASRRLRKPAGPFRGGRIPNAAVVFRPVERSRNLAETSENQPQHESGRSQELSM